MPQVVANMVDVYIFRRRGGSIELLQMCRADGSLAGTWHPVMGQLEAGETAVQAAVREMGEEAGLAKGAGLLRMWALEQVHPYFLARRDTIVLSARFAAEVGADWEPRMNEEHTDRRWVAADEASKWFMWPGQRAAVQEVLGLLAAGNGAESVLRVDSLI